MTKTAAVDRFDPDRLARAFGENFGSRGEVGASVSVWRGGEEAVTLVGGVTAKSGGDEWAPDTLVPVFSATKGPAAATVLDALDAAGLVLADRVAGVWPEFAASGKGALTFADVLGHRAGLAALDRDVPVENHAAVAEALADQAPLWSPGGRHGYHPRTFGFLLDEIVRRLCGGQTLGERWRQRFADPYGIDLWIGLPESEDGRVARVHPAAAGAPDGGEAFWEAMADPASLTRRAFGSPAGLGSIAAFNRPETRRLSLPAMGGIASARAIAKFYGLLAGGARSDAAAFGWLRWVGEPSGDGEDAVLLCPTAFGAGFMRDPKGAGGAKLRAVFGPSPRAFGHPGAGGCLGFADPDLGLGFAYVMNQLGRSPLPGARAQALVRGVYGDGDEAARTTR